jgi:peroxiredoxin
VAEAEDGELAIGGRLEITNHAWAPASAGGAGFVLPLPRGFVHAEVAEEDHDRVEVTAAGLRIARPLPPGNTSFRAAFALPITAGDVRWAMELPYGAFQSELAVAIDDGVTVVPPAGVTATTKATGAGTYSLLSDITLPPNQAMTMTVHVPPPNPAEVAMAKACGPLHPTRHVPREGKPAVDFTAHQLDGRPFQLASLRGKLVVLNFTASWNAISKPEVASFPALVKALGEVAVVVVMSDADRRAVTPLVGSAAGYRVVLDPPATGETIGPITQSWGISILPETYLIDRTGTVRYYIVNTRDWSSPESIACLKALAR